MRRFILIAGLLAFPSLVMAQSQTPVIGNDTPHDPAVAGAPHAAPAKPDQAAVTPRLPRHTPRVKSTRQSLKTKDPFVPSADQTPEQKALPTRVP